jgi:protein TonB
MKIATSAVSVNANEQNTAFEAASANATSDTSLVPPQFPGGAEGWQKYLTNNLKSNVPADNKAPAGTYTTVISFKVDEQGNISDVKVIKDPGFGTGAEAARVIKEGPKWIPAQEDGQAVTAMTKQAITFRIEEGH